MESSPVEQNLGKLVEIKMGTSHQGALLTQKAKHILGWIKRRVASRLSEVILFLLYSGLMRTHLEYFVQL